MKIDTQIECTYRYNHGVWELSLFLSMFTRWDRRMTYACGTNKCLEQRQGDIVIWRRRLVVGSTCWREYRRLNILCRNDATAFWRNYAWYDASITNNTLLTVLFYRRRKSSKILSRVTYDMSCQLSGSLLTTILFFDSSYW